MVEKNTSNPERCESWIAFQRRRDLEGSPRKFVFVFIGRNSKVEFRAAGDSGCNHKNFIRGISFRTEYLLSGTLQILEEI